MTENKDHPGYLGMERDDPAEVPTIMARPGRRRIGFQRRTWNMLIFTAVLAASVIALMAALLWSSSKSIGVTPSFFVCICHIYVDEEGSHEDGPG